MLKLRALGLESRFAPVLCSTDPNIDALKPHPRGFLRACASGASRRARCSWSATVRTSTRRRRRRGHAVRDHRRRRAELEVSRPALTRKAASCLSPSLTNGHARRMWPYMQIARMDHWFKNAFMLLGVVLAFFYQPESLLVGVAARLAVAATCWWLRATTCSMSCSMPPAIGSTRKEASSGAIRAGYAGDRLCRVAPRSRPPGSRWRALNFYFFASALCCGSWACSTTCRRCGRRSGRISMS